VKSTDAGAAGEEAACGFGVHRLVGPHGKFSLLKATPLLQYHFRNSKYGSQMHELLQNRWVALHELPPALQRPPMSSYVRWMETILNHPSPVKT
jgi:hypothetical protein